MSQNSTITLTGDSIIMRKISTYNDEKTKALYSKINNSDVAFTNLEVLPNNFSGFPAARTDGAPVGAHSYVLDDLKEIGFNLFSCANNHAGDYGTDGLLKTMTELNKRNLSFSGVGKNLTEARMPVYHSFSGGTISMISCTSTFFEEQAAGEARPELQGRPGVNPLKYDVEYKITEDQMNKLKDIYRELGLEEHRQQFIQQGFASEPEDSGIFPFVDTNLRSAGTLNATFRSDSSAGVRTKPNNQDMDEIIKWVKEARNRSDIVLVSVHAHEQGSSRDTPADFVRQFAHKAIDEGADIIVGHGPHFLKGMEIYKGKPIFYSLGNFIGHNELIYKMPEDTYQRFNVDSSLTPGEIFHIRSNGGKKGFVADDIYWETVMPICNFKQGDLQSIELFPISLTNGDAPYKRGRPYLPVKKEGQRIMDKFKELSSIFNTVIDYDENGVGKVNL